jgi:hypothetical protein
MEDLLGELDDQDEEELEQVVGAGNANYAGPAVDDLEMAFNKDEELNLKYNMAVGQVHNKSDKVLSKKRDITQITQSAPRASNPFKKEEVARLEIDQVPEMPVVREEVIMPE